MSRQPWGVQRGEYALTFVNSMCPPRLIQERAADTRKLGVVGAPSDREAELEHGSAAAEKVNSKRGRYAPFHVENLFCPNNRHISRGSRRRICRLPSESAAASHPRGIPEPIPSSRIESAAILYAIEAEPSSPWTVPSQQGCPEGPRHRD